MDELLNSEMPIDNDQSTPGCPLDNCNISELLPLFLDLPSDDHCKVSPSTLNKELLMPLEERLEQLSRPTRKRRNFSEKYILSKNPDVVVFQNFVLHQVYKTSVTFQNMHKVSKRLKVRKKVSPYFHLAHLETSGAKIAPGMIYTVVVIFCPLELRDYAYEISVVTEDGELTVPVYGLGPVPILNLPDRIVMPPTPVRVPSVKTVILHNSGRVKVKYLAHCQEPFQVAPTRNCVNPSHTIELQVTCLPTQKCSKVMGEITFIYSTFKTTVIVECEVIEADIFFENPNVTFDEEVYMGLKSHQTLTFTNRSDYTLSFSWKNYNCCDEGKLKSTLMKSAISLMKMEKKMYVPLEYNNVINYEGHASILEKNMQNTNLEGDEMQLLYSNKNFSIVPLEGQIIPKQKFEFVVVFSPDKVGCIKSCAYFDVTGLTERIRVNFSGEALGPKVVLNVKLLDLNDIFLNASYDYEILVKNVGQIGATVVFDPTETNFRGVVSCTPNKQTVHFSGDCKAFTLRFSSQSKGYFIEEIMFRITESDEVVSFLIKGNVQCPLLQSNVCAIDFGTISCGIEHFKCFNVINHSQVEIDYSIKLEDEISGTHNFLPESGILKPFSDTPVKLTISSNKAKSVTTSLIVYSWGEKEMSLRLPVSFQSDVPIIKCCPEEINVPFCFIGYQYTRSIKLKNESGILGIVKYCPTKFPEGFSCTLDKTDLSIKPLEEVKIHLSFLANKIGYVTYPLHFFLNSIEAAVCCKVICNVSGPVIRVEPMELTLGSIPLLQEHTTQLKLTNESPIPATLTVDLAPGTGLTVDLHQCVLAPENEIVITVKCYLTCNGKFMETIDITIENGEQIKVMVTAYGTGHSILVYPKLDPEYDLKTVLTYEECKLSVFFENLGKKPYNVMLTRSSVMPRAIKPTTSSIPSVFDVQPNYFELFPNKRILVEIRGFTKRPKYVSDDFYCYILPDKSRRPLLFMSFIMKANFIEPTVNFSEENLCFQVGYYEDIVDKEDKDDSNLTIGECSVDIFRREITDMPVEETQGKVIRGIKNKDVKSVIMQNILDVSVAMFISTSEYFYVQVMGELVNNYEVVLQPHTILQIDLCFKPDIEEKRYLALRGYVEVHFRNHPKTESLILSGEILYPTINIPEEYDFGCISLGSSSNASVIIVNVTVPLAIFKWHFVESEYVIENLPDIKMHPSLQSLNAPSTDLKSFIGYFRSYEHPSQKSPQIYSSHLVPVPSIPPRDQKDASQLIPITSEALNQSPISNLKSRNEAKDVRKVKESTLQVKPSPEIQNDTSKAISKTEVAKLLSPLITEEIGDEEEFFKSPAQARQNLLDPYDWRNVFSVEPWNGVLEAHEQSAVNLSFTPPPNVRVRAVFECVSEGGQAERMVVKGICSSIHYKLDKECLEFGHRIYNDICEGELTITNIGYGYINVNVICDPPMDSPEAKWLNVTPVQDKIGPREILVFTVRYYPGMTGEFRKKFEITIEYLEPISFYVHGYAMLSQVTASMDRPGMKEYDTDLTYKVIDNISEKYLESLVTYNVISSLSFAHLPDDLPEADIKWLKSNNWEVLSKYEICPSAKELELALERTLFNTFLLTNSPREDFIVPHYMLDFGPTVISSAVILTVPLLNNGPIPTLITISKQYQASIAKDEFKLQPTQRKIEVERTQKLDIIFTPTRKRYGSKDHHVENMFELKVTNGARIPIYLKAIVTVPRVRVQCETVFFEKVHLGHALRRSIVMHNDGFVSSNWSTEIFSSDETSNKNFMVIPNSGRLEPKQCALLNIYFIPIQLGDIVSTLNLYVEHNTNKTVLRLKGIGSEAVLIIDSPFLKFKSILPFTSTYHIVKVQNMSSFPMEYCFPDLDPKFKEEKCLVDAYLLYNKLKTVLLPRMEPGTNLPEIFNENYHFLINKLNTKLSDNISDECEASLCSTSITDAFKKIKGYINESLTENDTCETENLFEDDDPTSYIKVIDKEEENEITKKGTIIVFHGGPYTDYYKISNKVGIAFSIPVYSLDRLIYEEILANECPASNQFNRDLDQFLTTMDITPEQTPDEDDYEILTRKYQALTNFSPPKKRDSFLKPELTMDLIIRLLQTKLKRLPNLIIESLKSQILKTEIKALDALKTLTQNVQYIHLIMLNCTWNNYNEIVSEKDEHLNKKSDSVKVAKTVSSIRSTRSAPSSISSLVKKVKLSKSQKLIQQIPKNEFDSYKHILEQILKHSDQWNSLQQNFITKDLTSKRQVSRGNVSNIKIIPIAKVNYAIPVWVFNTTSISDWECQCNTIITLLKHNTEFLNALNNYGDQKKIVESSTEYTVLTRSHWKERAQSDVFDIDCVDVKQIEAESNSTLSRKRKSGLKGKIQFFTPRTVISPGEVIAYKVLFLPKTCGKYSYDYRIETIGVDHRYEICCDAKSQLPQIDFTPAKVFPNVLDSIAVKSMHDNFVYVKDKNTFYFGPILVGSAKTPPYKTTFRLSNNSKTPCKVTTYIDEHSLFSCKPSTTIVAPESSDYLQITVKSMKKGLLQSELYITTLDNPNVFVVKLYARACPIDISITPMSLDFEMVPLNISTKKKMQIKNNSLVNLWWKVGNSDVFKKSFKISPTGGALKAYSIEDIEVEYKSNVEENIKMKLEIHIFDMNLSTVFSFQTEHILLQANAVEYVMNYNNHITLGDIKAKHRNKSAFHIFNKGKFSINIRVEEIADKNDRYRSIRQNFHLKPLSSDVIPPEKACNVDFYFEFSKEVKLEKVPIFLCNILDGNKPDSKVLNKFFIYVSARVFLSKYEICPSPAIYFGYQQILSTEVRKVTVKNLGRFPFTFSLQSEKTASKSQLIGQNVTKKVGATKSKSKILLLSCFSITPVNGEVAPGKSVELSIECTPEDPQEYKQTMAIQISESYKDTFDEINLFVNGAEPYLDFRNTVPMFKEQFIVKHLADYIPTDKIAAHSIYVTTEQTLYFSRVCINTNMMVKAYLTNVGHVTAKVSIVLKEQSNPFFIFPAVLNIDPMRMELVYINFKPTSIGTAKNTMEIAYNKTINNIFQVDLVGKCCVPQIKLLEPEPDSNNDADITLPLTCIHEKQSTRISIQNIGEMPCKVILDLRNNSKKLFNVEICEDSLQYLNMDVPELRNFTDSSLLNLKSSEIGNFDINFCSHEETFEEVSLKIHTANNPFEIFTINVKVQTYDVDISIKGLPTSTDEDGVIMYSIDFGGVFLNSFTAKFFSLINNSKNKIYKFEFDTFQHLWILPKVGHLKPGQRKEIVTAASSATAVTMENVRLELLCAEIEYLNPDTENDSWDDRRCFPPNTNSEILDKLQDIINNSKSEIILPTLLMKEPKVRYVDKEQTIIPISLSLNINYASYKCEIQDINFPTTYVLEKSYFEFEIENTGYIPVNIEWMFECMVSKENSTLTTEFQDLEIDLNLYPSTMLYSMIQLPEKLPFSIEPKRCTIPTRNSTNFVVTFSPISQSVYGYVLTSKITCLNPSLKELEIDVTGESKMSKFYFEIGDSSDIPYVPKSNESDEEDVKIITFESVGVGTVCTKVCNLVNCYEEYVTFTFEPEPGNTFPSFSCKNPTGTMEPVKKFQVVFKFIPSSLGRFEEKYIFSMEGKSLKTTFILIGTCKEATVFFTTPHVTLPSTIAGADSKGQLVLRNEESITLGFKILKESLMSFCGDEELEVSPMSGKIEAKSDMVINLTYNAKSTGSFNFLLKCSVEKTRPISASVLASCLEIRSMLWYFKEGKKFVMSDHKDNVVNLGNLPLRKSTGLQIIVQNMGDTGFYYKWKLLSKDINKYVNVTLPEQTYVERMSDSTAFVYLEPKTQKDSLSIRISIQISSGRTYFIQIHGRAKSALCKFSFNSYNFNYCTVQKKNSKRYQVELGFQNLERTPVLVENEFENNAYLTVALKSAMVSPRSTLNIPIYFHPQKLGLYKFDVPLVVDSSSYSIKIKGEVVLPNIQLCNVKEKYIDLGKIKVGTVKKYTLQVVNRSLAVSRATFNTKWNLPSRRLNMEISDDDDIPIELPSQPKKSKVKKPTTALNFSLDRSKTRYSSTIKSSGTTQSQTPSLLPLEERSFLKDWILVHPTEPIEMQINKKYELVLEFHAKERLSRFSEKIFYDVDGTIEALCVIKGSCIAPLYYLDKKVLTFANIVVGNKCSQQVLLVNKGDISGTYNWTFNTTTDMFSINPTEGFLPPNATKVITVTFAPKTIQCQNTCKLLCHIKNSPTLELLLIGNSVEIPKPMSILKFGCAIGAQSVCTVPITNGSNTPWVVTTKHSTDLWIVTKHIEIPPQACSFLEITFLPTYCPVEAVVKDSLYLELPNGQVNVYELEGTILPPAPTDKIYREVPCKRWYTEVLTIENKMNAKQCYRVTTNLLGNITHKSIYKVDGLEMIDVLPNSFKQYSWRVYIYNEIHMQFKVVFTSNNTCEQTFFDIQISGLPALPLETICLTTSVRRRVIRLIKLNNPLNVPVKFNITCDVPDITFEKTITVNEFTGHNLQINYLPLISGIFTGNLEAKSDELGSFIYALELIAKPPPLEEKITFEVELGEKCTSFAELRNVFETSLYLVGRFDNATFSMEKPLVVLPGKTGKFYVTFEPNNIGFFQATATLTSPNTGDYTYPLMGKCTPPTPKGPIYVKPDGSTFVTFRNPFAESYKFIFDLTSTYFSVNPQSLDIDSKNSGKIMLNLIKTMSTKFPPVTGKLIITYDHESKRDVKWIYYLQSYM